MPATPQVFGPTLVKIDTDELGYTRNGADTRGKGYFVDVPGDENGGESGPPIDIQYMGETASVRLELTKFDATIAGKAVTRLKGDTVGHTGVAGTLLFGGSKTCALSLRGAEKTITFPRAFLRGDWEVNRGTRYSMLVLEFECHKDANGVLYSEAANPAG